MPRATRAYRRPLDAATTAQRITRSILRKVEDDQPWDVHAYTTNPDTIALVQQALRQELEDANDAA